MAFRRRTRWKFLMEMVALMFADSEIQAAFSMVPFFGIRKGANPSACWLRN